MQPHRPHPRNPLSGGTPRRCPPYLRRRREAASRIPAPPPPTARSAAAAQAHSTRHQPCGQQRLSGKRPPRRAPRHAGSCGSGAAARHAGKGSAPPGRCPRETVRPSGIAPCPARLPRSPTPVWPSCTSALGVPGWRPGACRAAGASACPAPYEYPGPRERSRRESLMASPSSGLRRRRRPRGAVRARGGVGVALRKEAVVAALCAAAGRGGPRSPGQRAAGPGAAAEVAVWGRAQAWSRCRCPEKVTAPCVCSGLMLQPCPAVKVDAK